MPIRKLRCIRSLEIRGRSWRQSEKNPNHGLLKFGVRRTSACNKCSRPSNGNNFSRKETRCAVEEDAGVAGLARGGINLGRAFSQIICHGWIQLGSATQVAQLVLQNRER